MNLYPQWVADTIRITNSETYLRRMIRLILSMSEEEIKSLKKKSPDMKEICWQIDHSNFFKLMNFAYPSPIWKLLIKKTGQEQGSQIGKK